MSSIQSKSHFQTQSHPQNQTQNQIKKCEKKLREISLLKEKKIHTKEELEKIEKELFYKKILSEIETGKMKKISFDELPDDVIYLILSYMPPHDRLNLILQKHPVSYLTNMLSKLPRSLSNFYKLYPCLKSARKILHYIYYNKPNNTVMRDMPRHCYWIDKRYKNCFRDNMSKTTYKGLDLDVYRSIKIILNAIQHFPKMYIKPHSKQMPHTLNEQCVLNMIIRILCIV